MKIKHIKPLLAATVAAFMLGGCYNQPGLVQDDNYNRTKTGAASGALAGALIGYNTKGSHKGRRALIGGLLGAAAGGAVGYSLDNQANEVAHALGTGVNNDPLAVLDPNRDIIVSKTPQYVKIMFRDSMMFATGSSQLQNNAKYKVNKVAQLLQNYPQTIVGVAGFTDSQGSYAYNQNLSQNRAHTVATLLSVNGYPKTKGCSYDKAIAPNNSATNRALNRRVEVYLYADANMMSDPCRD
ncbi:MAG: Outer membrane lipoprotein omp16 precursor [uncultured Sulfurovum sp.]|uniref:Outer membrane lipoprotein omp16 n=1 Tax=uncultured Sulfurovum sp. TaxID=269237 RepID=A0A6S6TBY7_9BACT|nr:MAG: Outer membrane lipoprotein omp16 precursor [uncultured Sulfurovum sp.]